MRDPHFFLAALFFEKNVVVGVGVEGRIEADKVYARVRDVVPQDLQIVAEVELIFPVHERGGYHN